MFRPFAQLDGANPAAGGTGLGLAIVREIARAHGGEAEVVNGTGPGARLRLRLPVDAPGGPQPSRST